jgi:hypothetical protein
MSDEVRLLATLGLAEDGTPLRSVGVDVGAFHRLAVGMGLQADETILTPIPKALRWQAFRRIEQDLLGAEYWSLLRYTWIYTDDHWKHVGAFARLWSDPREGRAAVMTPHEHQVRENIAARINGRPLTVYRGCRRGLNESGWSWCVHKDDAAHFARSLAGANPGELQAASAAEPLVLRGQTPLELVQAVYSPNNRGEFEIVVNPSDVADQRSVPQAT